MKRKTKTVQKPSKYVKMAEKIQKILFFFAKLFVIYKKCCNFAKKFFGKAD